MSGIVQKIKNNSFLALVALCYLALAVFMPDKLVASFNNSIYYVKEMLMIMPVILLLTALIEAWVPKKTIEGALGKDSGIKGMILSFVLGSFSAGPIYAAFPVAKMLLSKGANISNIVIILSTWAVVKVPMLANEAKFLGPKFMIVRWILTTAAIFVMAYIIPRFVKREDIPMEDIEANFGDEDIYIDSSYCIGCGICEKAAPAVFKVEGKKAKILGKAESQEDIDGVKKAVEKCPAKIIHYREDRED